MAFNLDEFVQRNSQPSSSGGFDMDKFLEKRGFGPERDLNTVEGLSELARESGLDRNVEEITNEKPKLSFLQRLGRGVGAFNPADALLDTREDTQSENLGTRLLSAPKFVGNYVESVGRGLGSAITGRDLDPDRQYFKDVVEEAGIENGVAKFGLGFLGDVLLDPTTYFGGAIISGAVKASKPVTNTGVRVLGEVAPGVVEGLSMTKKGVADAFGKAFVYGYGTSKGLADNLLEIQSKMDKARLGIVASNIERLGTKTLSPSQQEELVTKLVGGKLAEFTTGRATEAGKLAGKAALAGGDDLVTDVATQQAARSQKFAAQAGVADPFEVYFPFIRKDKISNFLTGTKNLRVGSEGYKKQFRNILDEEDIITNPAEAFARTEWNIVKDNIVRSELATLTKTFGKGVDAFASADEAAQAGYTAVKEKGIFGKTIGYMKEADKKFIDSMITPEFTTIDKLAQATGFDAVTALFKRSVTGLFVPFHVRNYVSGMVQNFETLGVAALDPATISAGQKLAYAIAKGKKFSNEIITYGGEQVNVGKAMNAFAKRFGGDSSYVKDIADITAEEGLKLGKNIRLTPTKFSKVNPLSADNVVFRKARVVGTYIEQQQKATAYIAALKQGKTIDEALGLAARAGFDYRALTPFESKFLRRIVPFYAFTRKNIELQLKTLGDNPERVNQITALIRNMGDTVSAEEDKYLPEYINQSLGIKLADTPEGIAQYISGFGTPIEAFAELINRNPVLKGISMMNPLLKAPIEIGVGVDSFRQRDLQEVYSAKEYSAAPKVIKELLDIKAVERPVLQKQADGKLKEVGTRIEYVADPQRLLVARSLFTSRGFTYLDEIFDGELSGLLKAVKLTTGIKIQQVDLERATGIEESRQKTALKELLDRYGEANLIDIVYQPKDQEARGVVADDDLASVEN